MKDEEGSVFQDLETAASEARAGAREWALQLIGSDQKAKAVRFFQRRKMQATEVGRAEYILPALFESLKNDCLIGNINAVGCQGKNL